MSFLPGIPVFFGMLSSSGRVVGDEGGLGGEGCWVIRLIEIEKKRYFRWDLRFLSIRKSESCGIGDLVSIFELICIKAPIHTDLYFYSFVETATTRAEPSVD